MIDFNDPNLVFEHKLREYTQREIERANTTLRDHIGNDYIRVNVEFDPADGGKWSLTAYAKGINTIVKGAMLTQAVDLWIRMFYAQHNIAVLPALIGRTSGHEPTDTSEEDNTATLL